MITKVTALLTECPVFRGMDADQLAFIAGCGWHVRIPAGDTVFKLGEPADRFFVLERGQVALEVRGAHAQAHRIATVGEREVLGWSWLFPPYTWHFEARAVEDVEGFAFDGACLRDKLDDDPAFGYDLMKRFAAVVLDRLQATRLQLVELHADRP